MELNQDVPTSNDVCRICHEEELPSSPFVCPCSCDGSIRFVHQSCIKEWIESSGKMRCEICNFKYLMEVKTKPYKEWEKLKWTPEEKGHLITYIILHVIILLIEVCAGFLDYWNREVFYISVGFVSLTGVSFLCRFTSLCVKVFWRNLQKIFDLFDAPRKVRTGVLLEESENRQAVIQFQNDSYGGPNDDSGSESGGAV